MGISSTFLGEHCGMAGRDGTFILRILQHENMYLCKGHGFAVYKHHARETNTQRKVVRRLCLQSHTNAFNSSKSSKGLTYCRDNAIQATPLRE